MRRVLMAAVFALAAASTTLAGAGIVVAPHVDPPGTPLVHEHVFAAYRYAIYLLRLARPLTEGLRFDIATPAGGLAGTLVLALLGALAPRLPRPRYRPAARVPLLEIPERQWRSPLPLGPPRPALLLPA